MNVFKDFFNRLQTIGEACPPEERKLLKEAVCYARKSVANAYTLPFTVTSGDATHVQEGEVNIQR